MPISDDFDAAVSDLAASLAEDERQRTITSEGDLTAESRMGMRVPVGARVRDKVSGNFGNVIAGTIRHILIQRS